MESSPSWFLPQNHKSIPGTITPESGVIWPGVELWFWCKSLFPRKCRTFLAGVFVFLKTVSDNFKNYTPNNGGAVTMCKYAGVFIIGMRLLNYYAQTKGNFETKKIFSFVGAVVWGLCGKFQNAAFIVSSYLFSSN